MTWWQSGPVWIHSDLSKVLPRVIYITHWLMERVPLFHFLCFPEEFILNSLPLESSHLIQKFNAVTIALLPARYLNMPFL